MSVSDFENKVKKSTYESGGIILQLFMHEGFSQVRVRVHGSIARIEVDARQVERLAQPPIRERIVDAFAKLGFGYVTVDLRGFRSGSMDEQSAHPSETR